MHKNCSSIYSVNILVKSVPFYLQQLDRYGELNIYSFVGPPCTEMRAYSFLQQVGLVGVGSRRIWRASNPRANTSANEI